MVQFLDSHIDSLYSIEFDATCQCAILTWMHYVTSEEFIQISERFLDFIQKRKVKKIINDARLASHITLEPEQQWLIENYIPRLISLGLKASAIIPPANRLIKLQVEDVVDVAAPSTIPTQYFSNAEDAKEWIAGF